MSGLRPRLALCYSGQMRWARMVVVNQLNLLVRPLAKKFEIDLYLFTDNANSFRYCVNGVRNPDHVRWKHKQLHPDIVPDFVNRLRPYVTVKQVEVVPTQLDAAETMDYYDNLFAQFQKLQHVFGMIDPTVQYEYVVRLRPDIYLEKIVELPIEPHVVFSNLEVEHVYKGDAIHVFHAVALPRILAWSQAQTKTNVQQYPCYEDLLESMFQACGTELQHVPGMGSRWYHNKARHFPGVCWDYLSDWENLEYDYSFDLKRLLEFRRRAKRRLVLTREHAATHRFDFSWPLDIQKTMLSAMEPLDLVTDQPELDLFFRTELIPHVVGLMPCAGTASRLDGLPKYLLPVPPRGTLIHHAARQLRAMGAERLCVGLSPFNYTLLSQCTQELDVLLRVGETATMTETICRMMPIAAQKYVLAMPDTYFTLVGARVTDLVHALDACSLAVVVWPIRPDQYGKLGQCHVEGGRVVAHRDKDPACTFQYAWGLMGWTVGFLEVVLTHAHTPHVGYLIDAALQRGLEVRAIVSNGQYFDGGTYHEYFRMICELSQPRPETLPTCNETLANSTALKNLESVVYERKHIPDRKTPGTRAPLSLNYQPQMLKLGLNQISKIQCTLLGFSRGSVCSGFYVPQLKLGFDAGIVYSHQLKVLCVTHCHSDHVAMLPHLMRGAVPIVAYVPEEHVGLFEQYNLSSLHLKRGTTAVTLTHSIHGVKPDDERDINTSHFLRVYRLDHTVPTRGYGVFQRRTKLKPEFTGLTKAEIQARKTQEELFQQISVPQLVYLCDTSEKVFEQAELFEFPVIIVECTFWHQDDYQRAKTTKHIHWVDLEPIIRTHPGNQFILIHFSERYNMHKLKAEIVWPENCLLWHESNPLLSVA